MPVLIRPITIASPAMGTTRQSVVKSPSSCARVIPFQLLAPRQWSAAPWRAGVQRPPVPDDARAKAFAECWRLSALDERSPAADLAAPLSVPRVPAFRADSPIPL